MNKRIVAALASLGVVSVAHAHISVTSGPLTAGSSQMITLGVPHGCNGFDTQSVEVLLPGGFWLTRPVDGDFDRATLVSEYDASGFVSHGKTYNERVSAVTWSKDDSQLKASDTHYYALNFRSAVPNTPFTRVYFVANQRCKDPATGDEFVAAWSGTPAIPADKPAASVWILPKLGKGWNTYTTEVAIEDLSALNSYRVVWFGQQAYSANKAVKQAIAEQGVSEITSIPAGAELKILVD